MKLREVVKHLTKYYAVYIANNASCYEDQSVLPDFALDKEIDTFDFFEQGDGEMLLVHLRETQEVDERQITFSDLKELA